ncbi:hypothetical protein MMC18_005621 [Xylographa bjoerkii]|nr:hypothetical protein [Xylographa bjoerkii]
MPYLDSSDGEWYLKHVISICDQARTSGIDRRIFTTNGMLRADSELLLDILAKLQMFLNCCRPFKDKAYIKVTPLNNVLSLGLVVNVDEAGCRIIKERVEKFGKEIADVVDLDSLSQADRAAVRRTIALMNDG